MSLADIWRSILAFRWLGDKILATRSMSKITIVDLEVLMRVGVPDEERAQPQRLLLTIIMDFDFAAAAASDDLASTIDYFAVAQRLLKFGEGRSWKLIEKLASDIADLVLAEFASTAVTVEVKKFPIPQARHVSVSLTRQRSDSGIKPAASGIP
jgi:FolB domain-containing protein